MATHFTRFAHVARCISLGRDPESGTRKYHHKTIRGSFRAAQTYLNGKLQERDFGCLPCAAAISLNNTNLSDRLEVPKTSDEFQRLSATLNRMLTRLDTSAQRMSQLTADASHELRAPVSLIRTTAELAVHGGRTNTEYSRIGLRFSQRRSGPAG